MPTPAPVQRFGRVHTDLGLQMLSAAVTGVTALAVTLAIGNLLGPGALGRYSAAVGLASIASTLAGLGIVQSTAREAARRPDLVSAIASQTTAARFLICVPLGALFSFAAALALGYDSAETALVVLVSLYVAITTYFINFGCMAGALGRFAASASITALTRLAFAVAVCLAAWLTSSLFPIVIAGIAVHLAGTLAGFRAIGVTLSPTTVTARELRLLIASSWPLALSSVAAMVNYRLDSVLVRTMTGEAAAGVYALAYTGLVMAQTPANALVSVMSPRFAATIATNEVAARRAFVRTTLVLAAACALIGLAVMTLGPLLITRVMGPDFAGAVPLVEVLALAIIPLAQTALNNTLLVAARCERLVLALTTGGTIVNVALNLALIPRYGAAGAAFTTLATETFTAVAGLLLIRIRVFPGPADSTAPTQATPDEPPCLA